MKKEILVLAVFMLALDSCNSDISKIQWAPVVEDVTSNSELKMIVLIEGDIRRIDQCSVLAKITDKNKVFKIDAALNDARYVCRSYDPFIPKANQKAICFVGETDQSSLIGYIMRIDWDTEKKKVRFAGGYSENLYKILAEYGVIEPEKRLAVMSFSSDPELKKIKFAPMPEYIGCHGNLKKVVFIEGDHYSKMEKWHELAEVTDPQEIKKIKEAFSKAKYCVMHLLESTLTETAIAFIYEDGQGELFKVCPNRKDQIVEFQGGYSEDLYDILTAYGIINSDN